MPLFASYRDFVRLEGKVDAIMARLQHILPRLQQLENLMITAADFKAKTDALLASVQANTDQTNSIVQYVQGLKAQLTDLQAQLAAAVAANPTPDLQAASDALDGAIASIDADTVSEAAVANT